MMPMSRMCGAYDRAPLTAPHLFKVTNFRHFD